jgi:hypothetical protein
MKNIMAMAFTPSTATPNKRASWLAAIIDPWREGGPDGRGCR